MQPQGPGADLIHKKLNDYWARIAEKYYVPDVFGRRILQSYIIKLNPQSLIEVGCGTGELFSAFKNVPLVWAVDWQPKMIERSVERIRRHEYKNIELGLCDITKPLPSGMRKVQGTFDIALTRTVLMHIQPDLIGEAVKNMVLLSDRVLAFEYFNQNPQKLAFHNWSHDYVKLFHDVGYRCVEAYQRPDAVDQILFIFERDKNEQNRNDCELAKGDVHKTE